MRVLRQPCKVGTAVILALPDLQYQPTVARRVVERDIRVVGGTQTTKFDATLETGLIWLVEAPGHRNAAHTAVHRCPPCAGAEAYQRRVDHVDRRHVKVAAAKPFKSTQGKLWRVALLTAQHRIVLANA